MRCYECNNNPCCCNGDPCSIENCEIVQMLNKLELGGLLYGIVEWINDRPILDGMPCLSSTSKALDNEKEQQHLTKLCQFGFDVRYTIIEMNKII